jgi:hypothetical protein
MGKGEEGGGRADASKMVSAKRRGAKIAKESAEFGRFGRVSGENHPWT